MTDSEQRRARVATPQEALVSAAAAIERLEGASGSERRGSRGSNLVVVLVCVLAVAGLVVHTFLEQDAPKVDETTVLLLAVVLFAPFVRHLRSIEIGGAKAEWKEDASEGLRDLLAAVKAQHTAISQVFQELSTAAAGDDGSVDAAPTGPGAPRVPAGARVLRRILWVDDAPQGNAYELESLRKLFRVDVATSTSEALERLETGDYDAAISDIVRVDHGRPDVHAGAAVAEAVTALTPPIPVFFYASVEAVEIQAQDLLEQGATAVTASYGELVKALRREARVRFDATVRRALAQASTVTGVEEQRDGIDYELQLSDGRRYLVDTPHWLRNPTSTALEARYQRLSQAVVGGRASGALLVTMNPLRSPQRYGQAPQGVQLITVDELAARLEAI